VLVGAASLAVPALVVFATMLVGMALARKLA
jgi:hypothetical protein